MENAQKYMLIQHQICMKISSGRTLTILLMINRLPTKNIGNVTDNPDIYSAEAVKAHCLQEMDLNAHCIDEGDVVEHGREDNFFEPASVKAR